MKKTNPIFTLKNFRSFGEEGADFELAPITVLTGCNSAGKSSLVKALVLLAMQPVGSTIEDVEGKRNLPSMDLKASAKELMLGGYNRLVHSLNKDGDIELTYCMWSTYLHEEIVCRRIFKVKKGVMNDGVLKCFTIEKKDGTVVYRGLPDNSIVPLGNGEETVYHYISEEEHFETIKVNYERFEAAYEYAYFAELKRRMDAHDKPVKSRFYQKVVEKIVQGEAALYKCGMTKEEAEEYDLDAIMYWHQAKKSDDVPAELKAYKEDLAEDEKEELRQRLFYTSFINEIVSPWFFSRLASIDSSTNKINRVYSIDDRDKLSVLLFDIVNRTSAYKYRSGKFVNEWLKRYEIGDCIEIEGIDEGYGVRVYVENKGERRLLADEGCGLTQIVSLLLQIDNMKNRYCNRSISDDFEDHLIYSKSVISIEEPEVHLHPKYQSMLADLFVEAYQKYNIHFIIETHSEYLIRKLQVLVASKENALTANDVSLNYVEKGESGVSTNRKIGITEDGRLMDSFGEGFFDEAGGLSRQLLKLNM